MTDALKMFVEACGGNPPDFLQEAYAAAEDALDAKSAELPEVTARQYNNALGLLSQERAENVRLRQELARVADAGRKMAVRHLAQSDIPEREQAEYLKPFQVADTPTPPPQRHVVGYDKFRNTVLEEAAKATETAQISGSLMRPGIAKVIRSMKTTDAPDGIVTPLEQAWRDGFVDGEKHAAKHHVVASTPEELAQVLDIPVSTFSDSELAAKLSPTDHVVVTPADQIIGQIEELFPNWRSYRDLVDCITCELHELRLRAEGRL